jgi:hypothetical protein
MDQSGRRLKDFIGAASPPGRWQALPVARQQFANLLLVPRRSVLPRQTRRTKFKPNTATTWACRFELEALTRTLLAFFSIKTIDGKPILMHEDYGRRIASTVGASPTPGCPWRVPPTLASQWQTGGRN